MMTVAEKIKYLRITTGMTQDELAKSLNAQASSVAKWEHGYVKSIPISKIKTMAEIFDVNPSYLIEDDGDI